MVKFNKEAFVNAGNENSGYQRPTIKKGQYELKLVQLEISESSAEDSQSEQLYVGWEIIAGEYEGKVISLSQNLVQKDGEQNMIGLSYMNKLLADLSSGRFTADDFEEDDNGEICNLQEVFDSFLDTVILGVGEQKQKKDSEYFDAKVTFKKLIEQVYKSEGSSDLTTPDEKPTEATVGKTIPGESKVTWWQKGGKHKGTIQQEVGDGENGMLMVKYETTLEGPKLSTRPLPYAVNVKEHNVELIGNFETVSPEEEAEISLEADNEISLEAEEPEVPLEKGIFVTYNFKGSVEGPQKVHQVDELESLVIVVLPTGKGRKVPFDQIVSRQAAN